MTSSPIDFAELKTRTHGLLTNAAYRMLYQMVIKAPAGDAVEVGTAHGAATIVIARALKDSGRSGRVHSIDKIVGGSCDRFGSEEDNIAVIKRNFSLYGVDDAISFYAELSDAAARLLPADISIGILMLDADGAIDRDFALFYNKIVPSGLIVIDDYDPGLVVKRLTNGDIFVDQKHLLTFHLVNHFVHHGLLSDVNVCGETVFARKPTNLKSVSFKDFDTTAVYRNLTFAQFKLHSSYAKAIGNVTLRVPWLRKVLKAGYFRLIADK